MLRPINGHCRARRRKPWNPGNAPPRKPDVIETASKAAPLADGLETPRRHWATLTLLLAITITVFDASMANVALPAIAHALSIDPADVVWAAIAYNLVFVVSLLPRSYERRVGTECVGTCSSRWSPYHQKKKKQ